MAWSHSDWITLSDTAARLAKLRLHIQEVSNQIGREKSAGDMSSGSREVREYLENLLASEKELAAVPLPTSPGAGRPTRFVFG